MAGVAASDAVLYLIELEAQIKQARSHVALTDPSCWTSDICFRAWLYKLLEWLLHRIRIYLQVLRVKPSQPALLLALGR